ncbi:uncharacterized protein METZ01_LOCUS231583 [marine metagenome]|uniref:Uncharacterized protein n=1 Tax=marine metagenome TaxID=408172 RepID=A0A382GUU3_9ZZZZ
MGQKSNMPFFPHGGGAFVGQIKYFL